MGSMTLPLAPGVEDDGEPWILTATGKRFNVFRPEGMVCMEDIAHALSNTPRFSGHTKVFYSVGAHSIFVSNIVRALGGNSRQILVALLHDAAEAYFGDISTPIKRVIPAIGVMENRIAQAVAEAFIPDGHATDFHDPIIRRADRLALLVERAELLPDHPEWPITQLEEHLTEAERAHITLFPGRPCEDDLGRSPFVAAWFRELYRTLLREYLETSRAAA